MIEAGGARWCTRCGRWSKNNSSDRAHRKKWNEPCRKVAAFDRWERAGHRPCLRVSGWSCYRCNCQQRELKRVCSGRRGVGLEGGRMEEEEV